MDEFHKGWFTEMNSSWPGEAMSLEVEELLHHEKSQYQDILLFKSKKHGRVLVLDGVIQLTERDEFAYHEPIAHTPLFSHPNPKSVLVVGGGDGGVLREVGKHPMVEEMHICEIDKRVIELSKQFLPTLAVGYSNPKVQVHVQDGAEFMLQHKNEFDVIITDSTDPFGPAEVLFEKPYFERMKASLKPGGILCSQGDCMWLDLPLIQRVITDCKILYPVVRYATTNIHTGGQLGFILASLNEETVFESPVRKVSPAEVEEMGLKYYNGDVHTAAFTLPQFAKKVIQDLHASITCMAQQESSRLSSSAHSQVEVLVYSRLGV